MSSFSFRPIPVLLLALLLSSCFNRSIPSPSGTQGVLSGSVKLDPAAGAKQFRLKLKREAAVIQEVVSPAGRPFRMEGLDPGRYDVVVEANGHSTFVKEGFASVAPGKETEIGVEMARAKTVFPAGDATPIIVCSACHKAIYMEMIRGVGTDLHTGPWPGPDGTLIHLPDLSRDFYENGSPEHLAYVAPITVASIAKQPKEKQDFCRSCHAPTLIHQGKEKPVAPTLREGNREDGVSCASCHLDKEGNVRGKFDLSAPHPTVQDPLFTPARSADLCAACHQADAMAPNQQTVSEWKADFAPKDPRTCQDCHMPQTRRRLSEIFSDRPERMIGKHLFAGGHSVSMLKEAAVLVVEQDPADPRTIQIGVTNRGAGHSFPTGHGPRGVLLSVDVEGPDGTLLLNSTQRGPSALFTVNPALGDPSPVIRPAVRAGATETVSVRLEGSPGEYRVRARLHYDLDRLVKENDLELPLIASVEKRVQLQK